MKCVEANVIKPFSAAKHIQSAAKMSRQRSRTITEAETVPIAVTKSGIFGHKKVTIDRCIFTAAMTSHLFVCLFEEREH